VADRCEVTRATMREEVWALVDGADFTTLNNMKTDHRKLDGLERGVDKALKTLQMKHRMCKELSRP
jgi:hypothetical protein